MSGISYLRRRGFLLGASLASILGFIPAKRTRPAVLSIFTNSEASRRIGWRCLSALPAEERSALSLRRNLPRDAEEVRERIRRDFAERHTIAVEGWVLAQTEVRLCALAALVGGSIA